jgi:hypothetical protein
MAIDDSVANIHAWRLVAHYFHAHTLANTLVSHVLIAGSAHVMRQKAFETSALARLTPRRADT